MASPMPLVPPTITTFSFVPFHVYLLGSSFCRRDSKVGDVAMLFCIKWRDDQRSSGTPWSRMLVKTSPRRRP